MARRRLNLSSPREVRKSANRVANMLINDELEAKTANAVLSACHVCLTSIRTDEQERRLDELEKLVKELTPNDRF